MTLSNINEDLTPAQIAHQKGYTSVGYGKWAQNGKQVATTVKGKLVPYSPEDETGKKDKGTKQATIYPSDNPPPKPTGTSAEKAGLKPSNVPSEKDTAKINGTSQSPEEKAEKGNNAEQGPTPVTSNPYRIDTISSMIGKHVDHKDIKALFPAEFDKHNIGKELVIGEIPLVVTPQEYQEFVTGGNVDDTVEISVQISSENIADLLNGLRIGEDAEVALDKFDSDINTVRQNALPALFDSIGVVLRRGRDKSGDFTSTTKCVNVTKMIMPIGQQLPKVIYVVDLEDYDNSNFTNEATEQFRRYQRVFAKYVR